MSQEDTRHTAKNSLTFQRQLEHRSHALQPVRSIVDADRLNPFDDFPVCSAEEHHLIAYKAQVIRLLGCEQLLVPGEPSANEHFPLISQLVSVCTRWIWPYSDQMLSTSIIAGA